MSDRSRAILLEKSLDTPLQEGSEAKEAKSLYGFDPLPPRGGTVSNELIDNLREEDLG
ncbi:MAG TPA: hypothetical protein VEG34_13370 [Thermoanaerobaculia bacterium]|nr:hypothetical protein [Thermoanaerobaculia bacterium]